MKVAKTGSLKGMFNRIRKRRMRAVQYWQLKTNNQQYSGIVNSKSTDANSSLDKVV